MENYEEIECLGTGAQGTCFLVKHKIEQKKYVMKKVECNDESECNRAFKEMMAVQQLQHPYITTNKEFFVHWDREVCGMFLILVSEYYDKGSLSHIITQHRNSLQTIPETQVEKWLGQLLDVLLFLEQKRVVHRALKPSNLYLEENDCVVVGDFGASTIMADIQTRTRNAPGTLNWVAPEVLDSGHSPRSDVWSVGCILLELTTTATLDATQMTSTLLEIKHNQQALSSVLDLVSQTYSSDLVDAMTRMLDHSAPTRPSITELCDSPYGQTCVSRSQEILADKRKKSMTSSTTKSLPSTEGVGPVLDYLLQHGSNDVCAREALDCLDELTKDDEGAIDTFGKRIILDAMKRHSQDADVQIAACNVLNNIIISANVGDVLYSPEVIPLIPAAMKEHASSSRFQQAAAMLLIAMSADEVACENLGKEGAVAMVIAAMRNFPKISTLVTVCCNAIWSLGVNEENARFATEENAVECVVSCLQTHFQNTEVVEASTAALISLAMQSENLTVINNLDVVSMLLQALCTHNREAKVVKNVSMALATMVEPDEECAFKVLCSEIEGEEVQGIPLIVDSYRLHWDNAQVVENICILFMELVEYEDICAEVKHLKIGETVLTEIHKRFKDNMDIMSPCEAALSKLGGKLTLPAHGTVAR